MVVRKSQELRLSTYIQLGMTKHPSRKVLNFRHLLGCDTMVGSIKALIRIRVAKTKQIQFQVTQ